ncbi:MAG: hypothetical protein KAX40_03620 [Herpetosiphon sp.]|nr:hypothetical protein [Herpetosiphon sp.]
MTFSLHPQVVHFPIALLLIGSVLTILGLRRDRSDWLTISAFMLRLGWWTALLASATGLLTVALNFAQAQRDAAWVNAHAATSLIIVWVYWQLMPRANRPPRQHLHGFGIILIIVTGWLGGHIAHDLGWR